MILDDDFLTEEEIKIFRDAALNFNKEPWFFAYRTSEEDNNGFAVEDSKTSESFQMVCPVNPNTPVYFHVLKIFNRFMDKHDIKYSEIHRIKFNILPMSNNSPDAYHTPHIDSDKEHGVFLYYVNDSDGDTFFFNETFRKDLKPESFTIRQRVSPKAGRAVVFDGSIYHASSSPNKSPMRVILNVDYIT